MRGAGSGAARGAQAGRGARGAAAAHARRARCADNAPRAARRPVGGRLLLAPEDAAGTHVCAARSFAPRAPPARRAPPGARRALTCARRLPPAPAPGRARPDRRPLGGAEKRRSGGGRGAARRVRRRRRRRQRRRRRRRGRGWRRWRRAGRPARAALHHTLPRRREERQLRVFARPAVGGGLRLPGAPPPRPGPRAGGRARGRACLRARAAAAGRGAWPRPQTKRRRPQPTKKKPSPRPPVLRRGLRHEGRGLPAGQLRGRGRAAGRGAQLFARRRRGGAGAARGAAPRAGPAAARAGQQEQGQRTHPAPHTTHTPRAAHHTHTQRHTQQPSEAALLAHYHASLTARLDALGKGAAAAAYTLGRVLPAHYDLAIVDYCRFMAGWGFWGAGRYARARCEAALARLPRALADAAAAAAG